MKVLSAHLWEKEKGITHMPISLVLQQACIGRKTIDLVCVCEGKNAGETGITESGYFTEGLTEWFHREGIRLCERKEEEKAAAALYGEITCLEKENRDYTSRKGGKTNLHYWGMFLIEDRAWIFAQGDCKGFLLNHRFQKKNMREILLLQKSESKEWFQVKIQKKIGILLCTGDFCKDWIPEECIEVLLPEGEITEERMGKRLQELWQEQVRKGRSSMAGAIYLRT
ncbi:MAG: hypothetical protein IKK33_08760 [Lachnospiraceae bacterium]|nr:hypothetical protein [Lachnospiraceae bacterium]